MSIMEILAVIPARGGSKGISNKNIRMFGGKPLIVHSIEHAQASKHTARIIVNTDSQEIADIAKEYGAEVPFLRPVELAGDTASVVDVIFHMLEKLKKDEGYEPECILLLQPTSPLRVPSDIDNALDLFFNNNAEAVVSVCGTEQLLYTKNEQDRLNLVTSREEFLKSNNRQELPSTYKMDGSMIYAIRTDVFLKNHSFIAGDLVGYVIPRWRAVDLDEPEDFVVGELIYNNQKEIRGALHNFK